MLFQNEYVIDNNMPVMRECVERFTFSLAGQRQTFLVGCHLATFRAQCQILQ